MATHSNSPGHGDFASMGTVRPVTKQKVMYESCTPFRGKHD
jgi:hypothetical protein